MRARCNRRDRRREYPDSGQLLRWVSDGGVRRRRLNATACSRYWHCACRPPCAAWHRPGAAHPSCRQARAGQRGGQLRHGRRRQIGRTPAQRDRACRRCARTRRLIEQAFQCLQAHALFVDGALLSGERQLVRLACQKWRHGHVSLRETARAGRGRRSGHCCPACRWASAHRQAMRRTCPRQFEHQDLRRRRLGSRSGQPCSATGIAGVGAAPTGSAGSDCAADIVRLPCMQTRSCRTPRV